MTMDIKVNSLDLLRFEKSKSEERIDEYKINRYKEA